MAISQVEKELVASISAPRIFSHVEELCGFGPRILGSPGAEKSIKYLKEQLRSCGAKVETAEFEIAVCREAKAELKLISPQERLLECQVNYRSAPSPPEGITTNNVIDVDFGTEEGYEGRDVTGAIVLAKEGGMHSVPQSELAARKGAAGCVWTNAQPGGLISTYGLARYGSRIPVVSISYEDGEFLRRLLSEGKITLAMRVDTELDRGKGEHVIGMVSGKKWPEDICILCAHYETVPGSPGANDNAAGVAIVLEVLRALASSQPQRTIWALLSTGEEGGAIGLRAFVAENRAKMAKVRAVINVDVIGGGTRLVILTEGRWPDRTVRTSDALNKVLLEAADALGYHLLPSVSEMGLADTEAFIEAGIAGAYMKRTGYRYNHTAEDLPEMIDANALKVAADILTVGFIRLDESVTLDNL